MKGVSEVIAIILILMITISLVGLAYMFMSTTMSDVTASAESTVDMTTNSMLTSFTIESIDVAKVYIRNTGQNALASLSVYVNDELAVFNITPSSISVGTVGTITIYSFIPDGATIKITSSTGFATSKVADECSKAAGCWKFDENDHEVNPSVIADDDQTSFWSVSGSGVVLSNDATVKTDGANSMKTVFTNAPQYSGFSHTFSSNQNWTYKSVFRFNMYGSNSGNVLYLKIRAPDNNNPYTFYIRDDFTGWKTLSVPLSSFGFSGSPSWSSVGSVYIMNPNATSLTGTWYFDRFAIDDNIQLKDSSGNGNDGTPANMVFGTNVSGPTTGKYRNALSFDGINDYVTIPSNGTLNITNAISLEAWVKLNQYAAEQPIIAKGTDIWWAAYSMYISGGGIVGFITWNTTSRTVLSGATNVKDGRWHHIVAVFDGQEKRIYVDGMLDGSSTFIGPLQGSAAYSGPIRIGYTSTSPAPDEIVNGTIDEVRIYNRAIY